MTVACTTTPFTVGGTASGLAGAGLVLQDNAGDDLAVAANGAFVFATAVASGGTFTVSVKTQPTAPAQTCQVAGGSGTLSGANVTSVAVHCGVDTFTIGWDDHGLVGTGLVLQNNAGDDPDHGERRRLATRSSTAVTPSPLIVSVTQRRRRPSRPAS